MIYDFQKSSYDKLLRTAIAHRIASEVKLPIRPRFHRLVIGESGSGKTHIAREVANELKWKHITLSCASWTVIGGRETPTWNTLAEWLINVPKDQCSLIILDEIDKVSGQDSWTRYLRAEVFSLMDSIIPSPTVVGDADDEKLLINAMNKTLVFGCGAFQDAFETKPTAGFLPQNVYPTNSNDLAKFLQRELVNRFDSDIVIFPQLTKADYIGMIEQVKPYVNEEMYEIVYNLGLSKIDEALSNRTAARFLENVLAIALSELVDKEDIEEYKTYEPKPEPKKETLEEVLKHDPYANGCLWDEIHKRVHEEAQKIAEAIDNEGKS